MLLERNGRCSITFIACGQGVYVHAMSLDWLGSDDCETSSSRSYVYESDVGAPDVLSQIPRTQYEEDLLVLDPR